MAVIIYRTEQRDQFGLTEDINNHLLNC